MEQPAVNKNIIISVPLNARNKSLGVLVTGIAICPIRSARAEPIKMPCVEATGNAIHGMCMRITQPANTMMGINRVGMPLAINHSATLPFSIMDVPMKNAVTYGIYPIKAITGLSFRSSNASPIFFTRGSLSPSGMGSRLLSSLYPCRKWPSLKTPYCLFTKMYCSRPYMPRSFRWPPDERWQCLPYSSKHPCYG